MTTLARAWALPLVAATVLLAGCGDQTTSEAKDPDRASSRSSAASETPESPSSSPSGNAARGTPACAQVWKADATLPSPYRGCTDGAKTVKPERHPCSSGQVIITYGDRFYAVEGGPVQDVGSLATSKQYRQASGSCQA